MRTSNLWTLLAAFGLSSQLNPDAAVRAADCGFGGGCGINAINDCRWQTPGAGCASFADAVEVRMCNLGLRLNGDLGDAIALGAVEAVDQIPDDTVPPTNPGCEGDGEEPRAAGSPSGLNIARTVLLYIPDDDFRDGREYDTSFLYIGWDLSDFDDAIDADSNAPVPYDTDNDGRACDVAAPLMQDARDDEYESYIVSLQLCTNFGEYDPIRDSTSDIGFDFDLLIETLIDASVGDPLLKEAYAPADAAFLPEDILVFPTADGLTNPTNGCIDRELALCGSNSLDSNNVEMVIKHVETQAAFGYDPMSPEITQLQTRLALAQLLARLQGGTTGDISDEEYASAIIRTSLPELEVSKVVRCADGGDANFSSNAVALSGSRVEYKIVIRNNGNEDLDVWVHDVMQAADVGGDLVNCAPLCETLTAELTTNGAGPGIAITSANAGAFGLNPLFFVDTCVAPDQGLLGAIRNNQSIRLGMLEGARITRQALGDCALEPGDVMTLGFLAEVDVVDDAGTCGEPHGPDCSNAVSVSGVFQPPQPLPQGTLCECDAQCNDGLYCNGQETCVAGVCQGGARPCPADVNCDEANDACGLLVQDVHSVADVRSEIRTGRDDNVATVELLCRGFTFLKEVGFSGAADSFMSSNGGLQVPPIPPGGFENIEFRYTVANTGDVSEEITVCDPQLCADLDAVGASLVDCTMCSAGTNGCLTLTVPAGADDTASCVARFTSQDQLAAFVALDDGRPECAAETDTCYRNCAEASAEAADLGGVCDGADTLVAGSYATICSEVCDLEVVKEVRCLPGCVEPPDPESGWVRDPELLDMQSGACLQYRITATNISSTGTAICALRYSDCMADSNAFSGGPANIQQSGDVACANLPAAFNWDCTPFDCGLSQPLLPGQKHVITFTTQVADAASPAINPRNTVFAEGASYCAGPPPIYFDCPAEAGVGIDVQRCGIAVTKEVTCDDPRGPGAVFDPDFVDALPGSTIGFRIQVCNTGDVELTEVELQDTLECGWPVIPGSILADVNGADVTGCICTNGPCATIDDLNGRRDLAACLPAAIGTNSCLTITFEAQVPADFDTTGTPVDCRNNVSVSVFSDGCSADGAACAEDSDGVDVNVKIPDVACTKSVCADANADGDCDDAGDYPFTDFLELPCNLNFPIRLIYRGVVTNTGETPLANVRVCDPRLAVDAPAAGLVVGPCDLCVDAGTLPPGASTAGFCTITVPTYAAWQKFAAADGASPDCYANTMEAQAEVSADGMCMRGADPRVTSTCAAEACIAPPCQIVVEKGVRCIDGCVTREALGSSWFVGAPPGDYDGNGVLDLRDFLFLAECFDGPENMPDPGDDRMTTSACLAAFDFDGDGDVDFRDYSRFEAMVGGEVQSLPVAAGATVEFEVKVTNTGDEPICALDICDELVGSIGLCPNPVTTAELASSNGMTICSLLPAPPFPVDGSCFEINFLAACGVPMQPGDNLVLHIGAQVESDAAGVIRNDVCVRCSPGDEASCATAPATYCGDEVCDAATLPVLACDFEVGKNVTCGEPRAADGDVSTTGLFDMNVAALPGSSNGFLITVCNTGDADICTIGIDELLDCEDWFVPGSVQATIAGSDLTGCLCPGGACAAITDLRGRHGLADCAGQCLGAGECLSITFEVVVPADFDSTGAPVDCRNTVVITGYTDICSPDANPCPQHTGSTFSRRLSPATRWSARTWTRTGCAMMRSPRPTACGCRVQSTSRST